MKRILIHLHPDFDFELREILKIWNSIQNKIEFIGLRPVPKFERILLTPGAMHDKEISKIADEIRKDSKFIEKDSIIIFTEKRIYDDEYYQLFIGGNEYDEEPPNIANLSLEYIRKAYNENNGRFFSTIISNILYSIGVDLGLKDHKKTKGCIMDFCMKMSDIDIGIENGVKFCDKCINRIDELEVNYLIEIQKSINTIDNFNEIDKTVTKTIKIRGKENAKNDFEYDIALSFAGEDRKYAEILAVELEKEKIKVFYDNMEKAKLWGKELHIYLKDLYRIKAKFCVIFISKYYINKKWTKLELKSALAREFEEDKEYILPIKLDETEISSVEGILPTKGFISWHEESVVEIVKMIQIKIQDIYFV